VLGRAGLIVQLDGASQAKSLSGWPTTDKADAMWLARLTETGLLRASFAPPKADHVGFASLCGGPEHGGPEPARRVTVCDWSSRRLGTWLARDTGVARRSTLRGTTKGPEHVGIFLQAPANVAAAGHRPAADPGARTSPRACPVDLRSGFV
jgi:hypothetical protein